MIRYEFIDARKKLNEIKSYHDKPECNPTKDE